MGVMNALFIHNRRDLHGEPPGGVQRCTREFLDVVKSVFPTVTMIEVDIDTSIQARIARWSGLAPYRFYKSQRNRTIIRAALRDQVPGVVFLNGVEVAGLLPWVSADAPHVVPVILSHGNLSGDQLGQFTRPETSSGRLGPSARRALVLGGNLLAEARLRVNHRCLVCVLSEEELILERWLGSRDVMFLPRTLREDFLEWQPVSGRVGYVGTLSHTPNRVAVESVLRELAARDANVEVEIAGGPLEVGEGFASRYRFVRYLGVLSEGDLRQKAREWSLVLNPIFWLSRGASMKLGHSISWGLPTLTTNSGRRGYLLERGTVEETTDDAEHFTDRLCELVRDSARLAMMRDTILRSTGSFPRSSELGRELKDRIASLADRAIRSTE